MIPEVAATTLIIFAGLVFFVAQGRPDLVDQSSALAMITYELGKKQGTRFGRGRFCVYSILKMCNYMRQRKDGGGLSSKLHFEIGLRSLSRGTTYEPATTTGSGPGNPENGS